MEEVISLTGNQLKIIAMIAMTCDHIGLQLLPQFPILRIIGRLAMPIYAYMIAEGCRYTHDRKKYFLRLFGLGALCQVVYFIAMGSLYMCILITFSLSVILIYLYDRKGPLFWLGLLATFFLCVVLPDLWVDTDFAIDYGIWGVLLPVMIYIGGREQEPLSPISALTIGLVLLALDYGGVQWFALATVPLLALYNGKRGTANIGKLFYWYYPLHLVAIEGLRLLLFC